ncbi:MAG: efflux RND transporter permease subunit [Bdellovibrionaceae bacterium]|nr:efflux RND transporter permease subunit [Pseudobdellovibrionaceae bacterium]
MNKLIEYFVKQKVFPELVTVLVMVGGLFALMNIRREAFPNVNFDVVMVSAIYPGASPKEVERLISSPLEEDIREVTGIKKMYSISIEGRSEIVIQVDPDQVTSDEVKEDVQLIVDRFQDLPEDAEDPIVTVIESKIMPVIEVALSANLGEKELKQVAKFVEKKVEKIPQVANVDIIGDKKYEYRIKIDIDKLRKYDVSLAEILTALRETNVAIPAGDFVSQTEGNVKKDIVVRTTGEFDDAEDIKNVVLRSNDLGRVIRVGDLADVEFRLAEAQMLYRSKGASTVRLVVKKKEKADAIILVDALKVKMEELQKTETLKGVDVDYINDSSFYIRNRLNILSSNLVMGLVLVLIILGLFMPFRVALIVGMGIPFSFLGTIWIFQFMGLSLNLITVMGLIIVVGMLVDDAVVVVENAVRYTEEGLSPHEAAIKGAQTIWKAVFASVMTTVLAFWPMTMITGVFGKFIKYIPLAVIIALILSMLEAYFILPSHYARWVGNHDKSKTPKFKLAFEKKWQQFTDSYVRLLEKVTSSPGKYYVVFGFIGLMIVIGGLSAARLKFILFPPDGIEVFMIKIEAPRGSTLAQTEQLSLPVEKQIMSLPRHELMNYVITVGEHRSRDDGADTKRGSHYSQAIVYLTPENERDRVADEIIDDLKQKIGQPENVSVIFARVKPGPPVGSAVNIGVRGENFEDIKSAIDEVAKEVATWPGVKDIESNYKLGKDERVLRFKPEAAALAGLSVQSIGTTVRALYEGIIPTTMRGKDEEIDVRVTFQEQQQSIDLIGKVSILNPRGVMVPLKEIVTVEEAVGIEAIFHEDAEKQFSVLGDVDTKVITALEVTNKANKWIKDNLQKKYPDLTFTFGGENEDTDESLGSLKATFLLALFLIFFILILTFENFYQPFLILSAIPLGIVAVLVTLILHGKPLSFMAMLGVIALAGVIVNNAIVFIDFVNEGKKDGLSPAQASVLAGKQRLRAVFLTTSTTVLGLLPTAYGIGGLDKFVVPVALSLGWGLFFGSILVMIFVPALIVVVEDLRSWVLQKIKRA